MRNSASAFQNMKSHLRTPATAAHLPSKEPMRDEIVRRTKSLRKPSGRKPGGQPGHEGNTLELNDSVDNIVDEKPGKCDECGDSLDGCDTELDYITQIISLPELKPLITEVRHYVTICRTCGKRVKPTPDVAVPTPLCMTLL